MFLWVPLIALVLWTVVFRYRRLRMYKLAGKIPGPSTELPVIGIAHTLAGSTEDIMLWLQRYSYVALESGGLMRGWLSHILYFIVTDPVDLEVILKSCLEKDDLHRFIRKLTGNGGIYAPVSIWRRRRKITVPAFSPKIVESFVEVFSEQSQKLTKQLSDYVSTGSFSIWPFVRAYTLDSVCESAMGVKINAQGNPNTPFLVSLNRFLNLACERIFHLWLQPDWLYKSFTKKYNEHQESVSHMHEFTDDVIQKKRDELRNELETNTEADQTYDLGKYQNKSFLDHLIKISGGESGFTNIELREEIMTLAIAGTDTSAVAIGFTLTLMAKYPEVQEKVYQELYDVFEGSDRPLVKEDLLKLKYLERVVKESLRLFPPVPFIIRKVIEEIKLPSGRILPAGSGVVCSIWGVQRDPKYWGSDAESFIPDRFLPERFNLKHSCSYMPFSQGPRNCLGYQYAMMSVKTAVSAILRKYKVVGPKEKTSQPHVRVKLDVMMKAVDGYQVALERRQPVTNKVH